MRRRCISLRRSTSETSKQSASGCHPNQRPAAPGVPQNPAGGRTANRSTVAAGRSTVDCRQCGAEQPRERRLAPLALAWSSADAQLRHDSGHARHSSAAPTGGTGADRCRSEEANLAPPVDSSPRSRPASTTRWQGRRLWPIRRRLQAQHSSDERAVPCAREQARRVQDQALAERTSSGRARSARHWRTRAPPPASGPCARERSLR